jgi:NADH dehydrogenase [ubiquinone] 1 alpha subcomplex assembly factor 5
MTDEVFDQKAVAMRRQRAMQRGLETFLHERAFDDIWERLALTNRRFGSALLVGSLDPAWPDRLREYAGTVELIEAEDLLMIEPSSFDLCVAVGALDTLNDLRQALAVLRFALRPDGLCIGALSGGQTLPRLRAAMRAADEELGSASPRAHPRIDPAALAGLLSDAGFAMPVVDVDRVRTSYRSLRALVRDLRSMGATNSLSARSKTPLTRAAIAAAERNFLEDADGGRTVETFEILHFAGWAPAAPPNG